MNPSPKGFSFRTFCLLLVVLGVLLRFTALDHKSYWHDEAYTSLRAAGYTIDEVNQTLFRDRPVQVSELQTFQQLKPQSTIQDTIRSLAVEDPQHPPFYFLLSRAWMQLWGPERVAMRSLAVVLGLMGIPLIYVLGRDLGQETRLGWIAAAIYALSPFELLFSQIARQYSLLSVLTLASGWCLWRSHRGAVGGNPG
ncbi:MAG: phospholipid carrier-dependent glycosyltransferase [Oscillatoriales cyanobacterium SM2_2_1]|nr:phospholipid carrier-dependent glycosyltransferase [Oscillatoriales cyanobacterium SM2_2_1]